MNIALVSPEMAMPALGEPACGANFRGGLGLLAREIAEGLNARGSVQSIALVPFYETHWLSRQPIAYENTGARFWGLIPNNEGEEIPVWVVPRGRCDIYGVGVPGVLYTSDRRERLRQEVLLGHAVPKLLEALSFRPDVLWLNEGHTVIAAAKTLEHPWFHDTKVLFTIHTPRPEGSEKFPADWFHELLVNPALRPVFIKDGQIDFTAAAMALADRVNAVSEEHEEVTKEMFPEWRGKITGIRNGLNPSLWQSPYLTSFNREIPYAALEKAQETAKAALIELIARKTGVRLDQKKPLVGLVRRLAWYKNQYPMLEHIIEALCAERGEVVSNSSGNLEGLGVQVFIAGLAHEDDHACQEWMRQFQQWMEHPRLKGKFAYLNDYTIQLLQLGPQACEIWLSCPRPREEACGQSDQRAALNGNVNIATRTGGAREYLKEVQPESGEGNGCFIDPYDPLTIYQKLKLLARLQSEAQSGDPRWQRVRMNALESSRELTASSMLDKYQDVFNSLREHRKARRT